MVSDFTRSVRACVATGCSTFQQSFSGSAQLSDVEFKYFGEYKRRAGLTFGKSENVKSSSCRDDACKVERVRMNQGYWHGLESFVDGMVTTNSAFYRSVLPAVRIRGRQTRSEGNIGVMSLWAYSYRLDQTSSMRQGTLAMFNAGMGGDTLPYAVKYGLGQYLGDHLQLGMFQFRSTPGSVVVNNRAVGSEGAGFNDVGTLCSQNPDYIFKGNEVHSSVHGMVFSSNRACFQLEDFTAWKIWGHGVHGINTMPSTAKAQLRPGVKMQTIWKNLRLVDVKRGVWWLVGHAPIVSDNFQPAVHGDSRWFELSDSLIIGRSSNMNYPNEWGCEGVRPQGLNWACSVLEIICEATVPSNVGIMLPTAAISMFPVFPYIHGSMSTFGYTLPTFGGETLMRGNVIANFTSHADAPCEVRDIVSGTQTFDYGEFAPVRLFNNSLHQVEEDSKFRVRLEHGSAENKMFEDEGSVVPPNKVPPKIERPNSEGVIVHDEDGTWLGQNAYIIGQARVKNYSIDEFLPREMKLDSSGQPVNVSDKYLFSDGAGGRTGFGNSVPESLCNFSQAFNAWSCNQTASYAFMNLASRDADTQFRQYHPVAFASSDGYVRLFNHNMFSMVARDGLTYSVFTTGSPPGKWVLNLNGAQAGFGVILKIKQTSFTRWNIFYDGRFIEDINMYDGKFKSQLYKEGKVPANSDAGYTDLALSLSCSCMIGSECKENLATTLCRSRTDRHAAFTYNRREKMLEVIVKQVDGDESTPIKFIEMEVTPVAHILMMSLQRLCLQARDGR